MSRLESVISCRVDGPCCYVVISALQAVNSAEDIINLNISGLHSRMQESVYKDVLLPLPDSVVWLLLKTGADHIVARTRYSPVFARTSLLRSSGFA